jgi:primosomal protein N' (replication factor Y)
LIIIFDEEDGSYKEEQTPRYHVRDAAALRSELEGSRLVYVSSSPSLELWKTAKGRTMEYRYFKPQYWPRTRSIDMTNYKFRGPTSLSVPLKYTIEQTVQSRGKVVLYMNHRGLDVSSLSEKQRADYRRGIDLEAQEIQNLQPKDQRMLDQMSRLFPYADVALFNKDSQHWPEKADIVIATQAIHRFRGQYKFDVIGVLNIDADLNRFDFRSSEKAYALLTHLAQLTEKKIYIQSQLIDHPALQAFKRFNFKKFYKEELALRKEFGLPPYLHLVILVLRGVQEAEVTRYGEAVFSQLKDQKSSTIDIIEANPPELRCVRGKFRYSIMLKGKSVRPVLKYVKKILSGQKIGRGVQVGINVDP